MTRYYYDTEFIEDGRTIDLISIGIVCDDGREYYAVNRDMPVKRITRHKWLSENVVPSLPRLYGDRRMHAIASIWNRNPLCLDWGHRDIKPHAQIADEVREFLLADDLPNLWAWYGAYDHVALAWLYGPMSEMPLGLPYWTNDLRQEAHRLGLSDEHLPAQPGGVHNALADARHNKVRHDWLIAYEATRTA